MGRKIFISHLHEDKELADALRKQIEAWGFSPQDIFQSSAVDRGGEPGVDLWNGIKEYLSKTSLVLFLYTSADKKWANCMWECGWAKAPTNINTKIIMFQCTGDQPPPVFVNDLCVRINETEIHNFTTQFHHTENFFPDKEPFDKKISNDGLKTRSDDLLKALKNACPGPCGNIKKDLRWGYFTLKLEADEVETLKRITLESEVSAICKSIQEDFLVVESKGLGIKHFGFQSMEPELNLMKLVQRWKQGRINQVGQEVAQEDSLQWITDLYLEIYRAICNAIPDLTWESLISVMPNIGAVAPVINETRTCPDGSIELDIYMYKVNN